MCHQLRSIELVSRNLSAGGSSDNTQLPPPLLLLLLQPAVP